MQDLAELLAAFVIGLVAGGGVNWAVYTLAWNRRPISPWAPPDPKAPPRRASDRVPVWGWFGLRREVPLHGRGFCVRPLAVELLMGAGLAALWWWEVERQGLVAGQFDALAAGAVPAGMLRAPAWITYATFGAHALLVALMAAASLIDIDEKTIPDSITVPGTLLALVLAAALPMAMPPHVAIRAAPPAVGVEIPLPAAIAPPTGGFYVEPTTPASPNEWPAVLGGAPQWQGLVIGLACFSAWCFALAPRLLRTRRGLFYGIRIVLARAVRELARPPLLWLELAGFAAIAGVWTLGGAAWEGLLSALIGMIGGSALVWAIRIAGSHSLRKEALGFGDVTLMMMVGAFLGWQAGVVILFAAPFFAMGFAILQLILRRTDEIFFGPFLCLATLTVMVKWAAMWNADSWIQQLFYDAWLAVAVLAAGVAVLWAMLVLWRNFKEAVFGRAVE